MRLFFVGLLFITVIVSPAMAAQREAKKEASPSAAARQLKKAAPPAATRRKVQKTAPATSAHNKAQKVLPVTAVHYQVQKVAEDIYAALALPGGKAGSNAMFFVAGPYAVIAGAHFTKEGIGELLANVAQITPLPVKYVILTHHHRGYSHIDFDFPPGIEIITSWQSWKALRGEHRELLNPVFFFETSMHLQAGTLSVALTNADKGHAEGNLVVGFPNERILFVSDLVYNDVVGYMGDGAMKEWVTALEVFETMEMRTVIPGLGKVTDLAGIGRYKNFMKDFLSEVIAHIDRGHDLAKTKQLFRLPLYEGLPGYNDFLKINLERAYKDVKE
jgi:glyoxylase-like metal-dependent hydrolase (beta-lactamase superfamily II)